MHNFKNGKFVRFFYKGTPGTTVTAVPLFDANNNSVTLQSFERLVIDTLNIENNADSSGSAATYVTVFTGASATASDSIIVGGGNPSFSQESTNRDYTEGMPLPLGQGLKVVQSANASEGPIAVFGTARIEVGQSQGTRPAWKESSSLGQAVPTSTVVDP